MEIIKQIDSLQIYNCEQKLNSIEKQLLLDFIGYLKQSKKIRFIYRGDCKIREHYNVDISDITLLSHYIFAIGEKGSFFLKKKKKKELNQFEFIWNKLNKKICELRFETESNTQKVCTFLRNNDELNSFFSNNQNKELFLNCANLDKKTQIKVIDYYIALLHTIGKSGINNSYFLSSTIDRQVADKFKKEGIVLYGWIPKKGFKDCVISYEDINTEDSIIKQLGLPIYKIPVYPDQKEICLKCGLLPHYIIGFQYQHKFYVNSNVFNKWDENVIYTGFNINQHNFNHILRKTNYKYEYIFCDGEYYIFEDNNIHKI